MQPRELWLFSLQKMRNLVCSLDCNVVSKARPRNPYSAVTSGRKRMTSERRHITRRIASQCAHKRTPSALSHASGAHRQMKYQARCLVLPSYSLALSGAPIASQRSSVEVSMCASMAGPRPGEAASPVSSRQLVLLCFQANASGTSGLIMERRAGCECRDEAG